MKTIYKYAIDINGPNVINTHCMPEFLSFQMQDGMPYIWLLVDTNQFITEYRFTIVGTGLSVPDRSRYRGTVQDGQFVWHLFELPS